MPHEHDYQKKLRAFLATLTEGDLTVEHQPLTVVPTEDPDELYRLWLLTRHPHRVSAARLPAAAFTLSAIEADRGLVLPTAPSECQMLAWLANWNYAGNPYRGAKSLKLRALVLAAVDLMMLDYLYEHDPQGADRSDYLGGNLIWLGYTYAAGRDALPPEAQAAFAAGLKKLVLTLDRWGPKGLMTDMDLFAPSACGSSRRRSTIPTSGGSPRRMPARCSPTPVTSIRPVTSWTAVASILRTTASACTSAPGRR